MYKICRLAAADPDFKKLVSLLDRELAIRDGKEHAFFAQFNKTDDIRHVILAYEKDVAVGCGAMKLYDKHTMEIKRMYVIPEKRSQGIASLILQALEQWALETGYLKCILETGLKQPEAIRLYRKNRYQRIPNYGQYAEVKSSVCFEKELQVIP